LDGWLNLKSVKERENKDARIYASYKRTEKVIGGRYGLSPENASGTSSV